MNENERRLDMKIHLGLKLLLGAVVAVLPCFLLQGYSEQKIIRVNSQIIPPYVTEDQLGIEDLLAKEIFRRLGYQIIITPIPAERGLIMLNQGVDDMILSRIPGLDKEYPNILQQQESAITWNFVAFTKNRDIKITSWDDFANYHVGMVTGWKIFEQNITRYKSLIQVRSPRQLFEILELGRVDVVVFAERPGNRLIKQLGIENAYAIQPPVASKEKYFYLHKRHAKLIPQADAVLREIKRDGTYERIIDMVIKNTHKAEGQ